MTAAATRSFDDEAARFGFHANGSTYGFYDVDDAQAFARRVADDELRYRGGHLNPSELDDLAAYLISDMTRLASRFDHRRGTSFSRFAYGILRKRVTSWYRKRFKDARYGGKRIRLLQRDLEDKLGRAPTLDELAEAAGLPATRAAAAEAPGPRRSSVEELLLSDPIVESLDDLAEELAPGAFDDELERLRAINPDVLTPAGRKALSIAFEVARGHKLGEIADAMAWPRKRVADALADLGRELQAKDLV